MMNDQITGTWEAEAVINNGQGGRFCGYVCGANCISGISQSVARTTAYPISASLARRLLWGTLTIQGDHYLRVRTGESDQILAELKRINRCAQLDRAADLANETRRVAAEIARDAGLDAARFDTDWDDAVREEPAR